MKPFQSILKLTSAALVIALIASSCANNKTFKEVPVDNPEFVPDSLFASYEDLSSPKFEALKARYQTDTIFHGETDELKRILLLRHWIHKTIKINNDGPFPGDGSVESILDHALKGQGFHCGHYTAVQNALMSAYGYVSRCLLVDVGYPVDFIEGGGHHAINEVWLNSYNKWFQTDAKYDCHFEKNGIPLSALEIRDEYLKNKAKDITLVRGAERTPIETYAELNNRPKEHFAIMYTWLSWGKYNNRYANWPNTNTDLMVVYEDDYFKNHTWLWDGKPFWGYKDNLMYRTKERKAVEWTPNTIESKVTLDKNVATVKLNSVTPNLKTYQLKQQDGNWKDVPETVTLTLEKDRNEYIFRTMNKAGVAGAEHRVVIEEFPG